LLAALTLVLLPTATASAGRLIVTGHDADFHCAGGGPQCHFVEVAVKYVRDGAPNPALPVLVLDNGDPELGGLQMVGALDSAFGAGVVQRVVVDPRSVEFATTPLTTDRFSAILIASDQTCGGCDLNIPIEGGSETPDSDAINARAGEIASFFNTGGGIYATRAPHMAMATRSPAPTPTIPSRPCPSVERRCRRRSPSPRPGGPWGSRTQPAASVRTTT
jgi:hypothetical protein